MKNVLSLSVVVNVVFVIVLLLEYAPTFLFLVCACALFALPISFLMTKRSTEKFVMRKF